MLINEKHKYDLMNTNINIKIVISRENEILRNQLKIYVGAVQNLQKDGDLTQCKPQFFFQ